MLLSNQTAVLFDHEYLWKESIINILRVFPWNDSPKKGNTWDYHYHTQTPQFCLFGMSGVDRIIKNNLEWMIN